MKIGRIVLGLLVLAIMVSGCIKTEKKTLIVYYSLSGNTKLVAEHIQSLTGADIFEIELDTPYPADYYSTLERARKEREHNSLPPLAGKISKLSKYDVVFIGSPNWFGTLSLPVLSFLKSNNLSGKIVVPFITFGGGGFQNTITDLKSLCPKAVILEEFGITGSSAKDSLSEVSQWLERIGIIE